MPRSPGRTATKQRVVAGEQVLVRIDAGGHRPLDDLTQRRVVDALRVAVAGCDAVLVVAVNSDDSVRRLKGLDRRQVRILDCIADHSTTGVIERIRAGT